MKTKVIRKNFSYKNKTRNKAI